MEKVYKGHKLYKNSKMKRITVLFVAVLMLVQVLSSAGILGVGAVLADTWPYTGDAATGDNQPRMVGHRIYDIEKWSPETDPYAELMRANVPIQERIEPLAATQANQNLKSEAEILVMGGDYGNSFLKDCRIIMILANTNITFGNTQTTMLHGMG